MILTHPIGAEQQLYGRRLSLSSAPHQPPVGALRYTVAEPVEATIITVVSAGAAPSADGYCGSASSPTAGRNVVPANTP
ncbi:MAG: hypothetical protein LBS86_04390 [Treponema sp.]|nr:hypothetical protein [Treponema sp.]